MASCSSIITLRKETVDDADSPVKPQVEDKEAEAEGKTQPPLKESKVDDDDEEEEEVTLVEEDKNNKIKMEQLRRCQRQQQDLQQQMLRRRRLQQQQEALAVARAKLTEERHRVAAEMASRVADVRSRRDAAAKKVRMCLFGIEVRSVQYRSAIVGTCTYFKCVFSLSPSVYQSLLLPQLKQFWSRV